MRVRYLSKTSLMLFPILLLAFYGFSYKKASPISIKADAILIKATVFTHTNDDDKDHDTGVYVEVKSSDGESTLLHANNRDNSGDDGTQYKDGSDHQFDLDIDAPGVEKSVCKSFKVKISQHTHGHDTWKFNAKVVLYFSDKTNITASRDGIELKNNDASVEFTAP